MKVAVSGNLNCSGIVYGFFFQILKTFKNSLHYSVRNSFTQTKIKHPKPAHLFCVTNRGQFTVNKMLVFVPFEMGTDAHMSAQPIPICRRRTYPSDPQAAPHGMTGCVRGDLSSSMYKFPTGQSQGSSLLEEASGLRAGVRSRSETVRAIPAEGPELRSPVPVDSVPTTVLLGRLKKQCLGEYLVSESLSPHWGTVPYTHS